MQRLNSQKIGKILEIFGISNGIRQCLIVHQLNPTLMAQVDHPTSTRHGGGERVGRLAARSCGRTCIKYVL
jgi:hypothetical protein